MDCIWKDVCINKTDKCEESCIRYIQMSRLLELSNLPKLLRTPKKIMTRAEDEKEYYKLDAIKKNIKEFVDDGRNLFICSQYCGNAKTTWACKLMLAYFGAVWDNSYDVTRGLFVHTPTLVCDLRKFDDAPEYIERIEEADLVIWDDIAFAGLTEYQNERLLQFIDNRINNGKSNIYTCNMISMDELTSKLGLRLASRVYNNSEKIEFVGKDFREGNL